MKQANIPRLEQSADLLHASQKKLLLDNALRAINRLSVYLEKECRDKPNMYKANQAMHVLWTID